MGECMIKMTIWVASLFLIQATYAENTLLHGEEIEEGVSYAYPFFYDGTDSFSYEDSSKIKSKTDASKKESSTSRRAKIGKAEFTVEVENTDFISQCLAERDRSREKNEPEEEKKTRKRRKSDFWDDDKSEKRRKSDEERKSRFWEDDVTDQKRKPGIWSNDKDEEEDKNHNPRVSASFKWSSDNRDCR
jgi:hypothetical protein